MFNYKKFLIVGDAGRGKSTLAKKLSTKLNIKHFELDDIFWLEKYSIIRDKKEQIKLILDILNKESCWVIEGSTRYMVELCFDSADCIINLSFRSIFDQWYQIIKRNIQWKRSLKETVVFCIQVFKKRYGIGNSKGKIPVKEMLKPYSNKVIELDSWKKIDEFMKGN